MNQKAPGGPGGDGDSSSSGSASSSLSSSVYSSTISSHLSGDEDQEKHHITDVLGENDSNDSERPVPSRISERESESSSKADDEPLARS